MVHRPLCLLALGTLIASAPALAAETTDFQSLVQLCAPSKSTDTLAPLVKVESRFSPYAIGVVGGYLQRQPVNLAEAVATAKALDDGGILYSAGIGQVFRGNWKSYGLTHESVFQPCNNLRASDGIYQACLSRAVASGRSGQQAKDAAYSCYYSNNFVTGFNSEGPGKKSYVQKIAAARDQLAAQGGVALIQEAKPIPVVLTSDKERAKPSVTPAAPNKRSSPEMVEFNPQPEQEQAPPHPPIAAATEPAPVVVTVAPSPAQPPEEKASPYVYPDETQSEQSVMVYQ